MYHSGPALFSCKMPVVNRISKTAYSDSHVPEAVLDQPLAVALGGSMSVTVGLTMAGTIRGQASEPIRRTVRRPVRCMARQPVRATVCWTAACPVGGVVAELLQQP